MISSADRDSALTIALDKMGLDRSRVLAEVEHVFGTPQLIVATGSITAGFGTPESDIDIIVVVERAVSELPIMSYVERGRIDVEYYSRSDLLAQFELLCGSTSVGAKTQLQWRRIYRAMRTLTRLEHSCVLYCNAEWREQLARLETADFRQYVEMWWWCEATRFFAGASWLAGHHHTTACLRMHDGLLAVLSARAASRGQVILSKKWLANKLRCTGDSDSLNLLRRVLGTNPRCDNLRELSELLESGLTEHTPPALRLYLGTAPGVDVLDLKERFLVSRWGMRGVQIVHSALGREVPVVDEWWWSGSREEVPPDIIRTLFQEDMLWLGAEGAQWLSK